MIGLGSRQGLEDARSFSDSFGPFTFPLLWDASGESWAQIGITVQPGVAIYRADGTLLEKWYGGLERADALLERLSA